MSYLGREPLSGEVVILDSIESQFNGTLATFNLTRTSNGVTSNFYPVSSEQLLVSLGGVIQKPDRTGDTGFKISFNQIIFAVAPPTGAKCFIVSYGNILDIGVPANETVTPAKLSTGGMYWDTSGNVGIGTTNPSYKLQVWTSGSQLHAGPVATSGLIVNCTDATFNRSATLSNPNVDGSGGGVAFFIENNTEYTGIYVDNFGNPSIRSTRSGTPFTLRSSGAVAISPNNTEAVRVISGGNVGIGTTNPSYKLSIGSEAGLDTSTTTVTSTSATTISTISATVCRSARYQIQITQGTEYQTADILAIHNGTTVNFMEYANISTGASPLGTFSLTISGGNLLLQVTMGSATSATIKICRTAIGV